MGQRPLNVMRVRVELAMLDFGKLDELKELFASKPGSCAVAFDLVSSESRRHAARRSARAGGPRTGPRYLQAVRRKTQWNWKRAASQFFGEFGGTGFSLCDVQLRKIKATQAEACATDLVYEARFSKDEIEKLRREVENLHHWQGRKIPAPIWSACARSHTTTARILRAPGSLATHPPRAASAASLHDGLCAPPIRGFSRIGMGTGPMVTTPR